MKIHKRVLSVAEVGWLETGLQLQWSSHGTRQTSRRRMGNLTRRFGDILFFGESSAASSNQNSRAKFGQWRMERLRRVGWSVLWRSRLESTLRPKREESGGLRLFTWMTRYSVISICCATLASFVSVSSKTGPTLQMLTRRVLELRLSPR